MALFKNEKVEKVNEQLSKLQAKKKGIETTISDMELALEQTTELYAMGEIGEKDINEALEFLKERRAELADIERMLAKVASVKNKVKVESLPMIREWRNKQIASVQVEVDKAVTEALEAREAYVKKLAAVGQAAKKIDPTTSQYNDLMRELGEREDSGSRIGIPHVFPETTVVGLHIATFEEVKSIGLSKKTQEDAAKRGILPSWVGGDSK